MIDTVLTWLASLDWKLVLGTVGSLGGVALGRWLATRDEERRWRREAKEVKAREAATEQRADKRDARQRMREFEVAAIDDTQAALDNTVYLTLAQLNGEKQAGAALLSELRQRPHANFSLLGSARLLKELAAIGAESHRARSEEDREALKSRVATWGGEMRSAMHQQRLRALDDRPLSVIPDAEIDAVIASL